MASYLMAKSDFAYRKPFMYFVGVFAAVVIALGTILAGSNVNEALAEHSLQEKAIS